AAPVVVVASALIINIRLIFYSATMARYWRGTPGGGGPGGAHLVCRPCGAVGGDRDPPAPPAPGAPPPPPWRGRARAAWGRRAALAVGAMVGAGWPTWLHLEFVIPLYLVGQAISKLANLAQRRAILAAATVALLALSAPLQLGIPLAITAGLAAGLTAEVRQ